MTEIMTPSNDKWDEFIERLVGSEGCDFKENENGNFTWKCKGGHDKTFAKKILSTMDVDVGGSLAYFESCGGYCDCEIVFNVDPSE